MRKYKQMLTEYWSALLAVLHYESKFIFTKRTSQDINVWNLHKTKRSEAQRIPLHCLLHWFLAPSPCYVWTALTTCHNMFQKKALFQIPKGWSLLRTFGSQETWQNATITLREKATPQTDIRIYLQDPGPTACVFHLCEPPQLFDDE
jgi:hypothetical protein